MTHVSVCVRKLIIYSIKEYSKGEGNSILMRDIAFEEVYNICKMNYYTDRSVRVNYIDIADQCTKGILVLWDVHCLDVNNCKGNIFCHKFNETDAVTKHEYLFAMDYLTYVLTAYKETRKEIYKITFEKIIGQFHKYLKTNGPVLEELAVYAQTLLFIKALDILGSIPYQRDFLVLLKEYASWLMNDENYMSDNNHGLFQDLALLHISVLFGDDSDSAVWKEHAVRRINQLFQNTYYKDFTNVENSMTYFRFNNYLYEQVVQFCKYYNVDNIKELENKLKKAKEALIFFAHKDGSFPLIGDGEIFYCAESNTFSKLFSDIGIAIIKAGESYISFKCKTIHQAHAHIDVSSITARYKDIDFLIDSGQYNYDRYTPVNRYIRSSAGHSGIFPVFADNMFQKEFCDALEDSHIAEYEHNKDTAYVKGEYRLRKVYVCREISAFPNEIIVKDSWNSEIPAVMRQRFVLPKELISKSRFIASQHMLETECRDVKFKYEIISDSPDAFTTVQFGIASPQYNAYEETMLLDTFVENALSGEITAKITITGEGE